MDIILLEEKLNALNKKVYECSKELAELNITVRETKEGYERLMAALVKAEGLDPKIAEAGAPL